MTRPTLLTLNDIRKVEKGQSKVKFWNRRYFLLLLQNTFSAITFDIFKLERSNWHHIIAKDKAYLTDIKLPSKGRKRSKVLKVKVRSNFQIGDISFYFCNVIALMTLSNHIKIKGIGKAVWELWPFEKVEKGRKCEKPSFMTLNDLRKVEKGRDR